jgi:hypothetical protein
LAKKKTFQTSSNTLHRRIFERVTEHATGSFIESHIDGVAQLSDDEVSNVGIVMEGSAADFLKPRHCGFYSVGQLDERHYALAFNKGVLELVTSKCRWTNCRPSKC